MQDTAAAPLKSEGPVPPLQGPSFSVSLPKPDSSASFASDDGFGAPHPAQHCNNSRNLQLAKVLQKLANATPDQFLTQVGGGAGGVGGGGGGR